MKFPTFRVALLAAAALLVMAGAVACGDDDDDDGNGGNGGGATTTATTPSGNGGGGGGGDEVDEITVSMKDNFFEPDEIRVPVGKTVTIIAKNDGVAIHNMVVLDTEFKSDQIVNGGQESRFEVTFTEAGEYAFQCDFHVPDMVGVIIAE